MRYKLILLWVFLPMFICAQNGITFKIEELSKPDRLLPINQGNDIFRHLILSEVDLSLYEINQKKIDFPFDILSTSQLPDSLVGLGYHSFFDGMYMAYAQHRPFVISPDMIWLLISQGFAQHVNQNAEQLRKHFVDYNGKVSLLVNTNAIQLDNPDSPWESVFPDFTRQIGAFTGDELMKVLSCDFSTTTPTSKIASEVTIMKAMKPYFDFIVFYMVCGIPEITLEGTTADWEKVLDKAKYLRKYELGWWIDEMEPLLKEFVKASKGDVNKRFWRNMFKYHSQKKYGAPKIIDGWIVKFFPYDKDGRRNKLKELTKSDNLPEEIVKVDVQYVTIENGKTESTPLEFWAGFVGLEQNSETFALKPHIGWMVRKKDVENDALSIKLKEYHNGGIDIRVKTFPKELLKLDHINSLSIEFIDEINIPQEISAIKIDMFDMKGKISPKEIERICKLLPETKLMINDQIYNER